MSKYYIKKASGLDLTLVDLGQSTRRERIDAKKINWNLASSKWAISEYSTRQFDENGLEKNVIIGVTDTLIDLDFSPTEIQQQARKPDELDYYRLTERIYELKGNGVDTVKWEVTRYIKVSFAFTNLIVILCGIPLVVLKEKNSLSFGAGSSVFVIFGYYAFIKFGQSLGFKGVIAPLLSAWIGNLVFMAAGILLFWRAKT